MSCVHQYGILQNSFTALNISCVSPNHHFLTPPWPLTPDYHISLLSFPECHIVGVIQYAAFSDWLLLFSNMHLRLLRVFSWLDNSFLFFFFNILFFLEEEITNNKTLAKWVESTATSHILPLPSHMHSLPHHQHPTPEWYICYNKWTYIDTSLSPTTVDCIRVCCWYCILWVVFVL